MNVLLTCAGRRTYLVNYFRTALMGQGKVIAADANRDAPAMIEADEAVCVPRVDSPNYIDVLVNICQNHHIGLLLPLNDLELPILAHAQAKLRQTGAIPVIASLEVVDICFDKWHTFCYLRDLGLRVPLTYNCLEDALIGLHEKTISFPMMVKPRWGSGSIGIALVEDEEELRATYALAKRRIMKTFLGGPSSADPQHCILIQERLQGSEYGLDIINDLEGNHITTFVKRKLAMRSGETERAVTVDNEELRILGRQLGSTLKHIGNLDCDVFFAQGEIPCVLELNPRFGGGYPFSHEAGANLPAALIAWASGQRPAPEWFVVQPGVLGAKYDLLATRRLEEPNNS